MTGFYWEFEANVYPSRDVLSSSPFYSGGAIIKYSGAVIKSFLGTVLTTIFGVNVLPKGFFIYLPTKSCG